MCETEDGYESNLQTWTNGGNTWGGLIGSLKTNERVQ